MSGKALVDSYPPLTERIQIVRRTRSAAAQALAEVLSERATVSERQLCDRWLACLTDKPALRREGWYRPPPGGLAALISVGPDFSRAGHASLRPAKMWPRADIFLDSESLLYAYASPVDQATGLIGDLGVTLYRGSNRAIQAHIAQCYAITSRIIECAAVGMEFRELYRYGLQLIHEAGLVNPIYSSTDNRGTNIGHTIPWSYTAPDPAQVSTLRDGTPDDIAAAISDARVFLNDSERLKIQRTMAFTIEPRMVAPGLPMVSFHIIVAFTDGAKSVLTEFGQLLSVSG